MNGRYEYVLSLIGPIGDLIKWINKQRGIIESKKRFLMAIKNEAKAYFSCFDDINNNYKALLPLIKNLESENATRELINLILLNITEGINILCKLINTYVSLSIAIKEFSVNEDLMSKLRPNGFLYDFVCRIRDTVLEDNKIHIGREYFRFILTYQDKIFKDLKKDEIEKSNKEIQTYINILKQKFRPALIIMSKRRMFKKKYIKMLFLGNIKHLNNAKNNLIIETPISEIKKYYPKKLSSIITIYEQITILEYKSKRERPMLH